MARYKPQEVPKKGKAAPIEIKLEKGRKDDETGGKAHESPLEKA